ncbi:hypothetical protein BBJ28_00015739 [Nothophytophthora sp. Chile5]|nr:hypothetical protein BBJ28_00015739 [Nothophytophthora sp. Chile5]
MGVHPQVVPFSFPKVEDQVTKPRVGSPLGKHSLRRSRHQPEEPEAVVLPAEAQQLKEKILKTNKTKLVRFSLSQMKKVAVPPVAIPKEMNSYRALSVTVAGRSVPLTKGMWNNMKKKVVHLQQIEEAYPLLSMCHR